jgi:hypothetical protein
MSTGQKIAAKWLFHDTTSRGKLAKLIDAEIQANTRKAADKLWDGFEIRTHAGGRVRVSEVRDIILNP